MFPYRTKKSLGQHFLREREVILAITESVVSQGDAIIEIGPGRGALTEILAQRSQPLYLFEKDRSLRDGLERYTPQENIHFGDALEIDFPSFCRDHSIEWAQVVGNLPYNVSVPLLIKFLKVLSFKRMILMFQKEVALKIFDPSGKKKNRGSLMGLSQNYCDIKFLTSVGASSFFPKPKVESSVLIFDRLDDPPIPLKEFSSFETFLRNAFSHRRKQLAKVLLREEGEAVFSSLGLDIRARAEDLSLEDLRRLYRSLDR